MLIPKSSLGLERRAGRPAAGLTVSKWPQAWARGRDCQPWGGVAQRPPLAPGASALHPPPVLGRMALGTKAKAAPQSWAPSTGPQGHPWGPGSQGRLSGGAGLGLTIPCRKAEPRRASSSCHPSFTEQHPRSQAGSRNGRATTSQLRFREASLQPQRSRPQRVTPAPLLPWGFSVLAAQASSESRG